MRTNESTRFDLSEGVCRTSSQTWTLPVHSRGRVKVSSEDDGRTRVRGVQSVPPGTLDSTTYTLGGRHPTPMCKTEKYWVKSLFYVFRPLVVTPRQPRTWGFKGPPVVWEE